jgi:hypothetical protein
VGRERAARHGSHDSECVEHADEGRRADRERARWAGGYEHTEPLDGVIFEDDDVHRWPGIKCLGRFETAGAGDTVPAVRARARSLGEGLDKADPSLV